MKTELAFLVLLKSVVMKKSALYLDFIDLCWYLLVVMHIEHVPNRGRRPTILLRQSYREGKKVRKRTLANLTHWRPEHVEGLQVLLKGGTAIHSLDDAFSIERSLPHGHVAAVLGTVRKLGLDKLIAPGHSRQRKLVLAMVVERLVTPRSKLAVARALSEPSCGSSLSEELCLGQVDEDELYGAMDWLLERQDAIEKQLAERHLHNGDLVLYDLTSVALEGRKCPLGKLGYSRDNEPGKPQVVFGLLCDKDGRPVAVEGYAGNVSDPNTVADQVRKCRERFELDNIVLVGDRGLLTQARIEEDLKPNDGIDWISALRAPQIQALVECGSIQLSLFDQKDLAEISHPKYPGERLVVCRNPLLAEERQRKRRELLEATERLLDPIVAATARQRRPLRGKDKIGLRVGRLLNRHKMGKHFKLNISEGRFSYQRDEQSIAHEERLDGLYVIRTSVPAEQLDSEQTVLAYKRLSRVEQAFRSYKRSGLQVRPVYHRRPKRVRAHLLICMLAYYVEWHMRQALAPLLFKDHDPQAAEAARESVVQPAQRSEAAKRKARSKKTDDGLPVSSFNTLLRGLGTIVKNRIRPRLPSVPTFEKLSEPTPLQERAFQLLGVRLRCSQ